MNLNRIPDPILQRRLGFDIANRLYYANCLLEGLKRPHMDVDECVERVKEILEHLYEATTYAQDETAVLVTKEIDDRL